MAWMSDEAWEMVSDSRDKKITARSARSTRTHCGKRGAVKFPSDYKTRKELKAMNGDVVSYRMNEPMSWDEFVKMPVDLQRKYIEHLREKFNVPDQYIAEMLGKERSVFVDHLFRLKMSADKWTESTPWDSEGFAAWRLGIEKSESEPAAEETKLEQPIDILDRPMKWGAFKSLTKEQQIEYIKRLMDKYDVPGKALGEMFGVHPTNVTRLVREFGIGSGGPRPRRAWKKDEFWAWVNGTEFYAAETAIDIPEETEHPEIIIGEVGAQNKMNEANETPGLSNSEKEYLDKFVEDLRELSAEVAEGAKAKTEKKTEEPVDIFKNAENAMSAYVSQTETKRAVPEEGKMTFNGNADDILRTIGLLLNNSNVCLEVKWFINN